MHIKKQEKTMSKWTSIVQDYESLKIDGKIGSPT